MQTATKKMQEDIQGERKEYTGFNAEFQSINQEFYFLAPEVLNNWPVKEVRFGMMEGETSRGRPCRDWLDDSKGMVRRRTLNRKNTQQEGTGS